MLPSKCLLCNQDLLLDEETNLFYCPNNKHYRYTVRDAGKVDARLAHMGLVLIETFYCGKYTISNHVLFEHESVDDNYNESIIFDGKSLEIILCLPKIRLLPGISEKKIQTYITFS